MTDSPHTPINLITSNSHSIYNQLLKSPLDINDQADSNADGNNSLENPITTDNIEIMINNLLIILENPKLNSNEINKSQIMTILQKCLITISHYKLQNEILRFENNENNKRKSVEDELNKKQIDYLLKSPFKPSSSNTLFSQKDEEPITTTSSSSRRSRRSVPKSKISKPSSNSKNTLKLVEKFNNHGNNEFNNCIKVFHLEKN